MKSLIFSRIGFVTMVMLVLIYLAGRLGMLDNAGYALYDNIRMLGQPPSSNVLVVAIDEFSLDKIGRYPVPNETHVQLLENLISAGVELIAYVGLPSLNSLANSNDTLASPPVFGQDLAALVADIRNQGLVIAGIPFVSTSENDRVKTALPGYLLQNSLPNEKSLKLHTARPAYPLPESASGPAESYASIFVENDVSKIIRSVPLFTEVNGLLIPSLAMQLYLRVNDMRLSDVKFTAGNKLSVAGSTILTDRQLQVWPYYYPAAKNGHTVEIVSYHDVRHGAVPAGTLSGKIVLLGVTAQGLAQSVSTPTDNSVPAVMMIAEALASMLDDKVIAVSAWASIVSTALLVLVAILLLWLSTQDLKARVIVTAVLILMLLGIQTLFLLEASTWLNMYPPILLLLLGFLVIALMAGGLQQSEKPTAMSGEVHRRVGLASQKRGELDAAFESFRKCPLENSIMVMLFYLAQDFEASGRFDRAVAVYQYMESFNPHFNELQDKLEKARMMEDTVRIDESKITPAINTAITSLESANETDSDSGEQRTLGRYLVQKEIGKGAMGMVYRGTDPKINRTVAIKTLNLKREFDEDEQENVLGRFFHEAEAAGRLHHPHIVTIYDAGEHNELAYIAMEFLTGSDLRVYTKKGTMLPPLTVVKIGMKLAGALFYAHSHDIVHRDIKAANVMYDPDSGQLKITDFGIARLTDSRRTKTGMVLGTPSSMSPEQLRGKKLDGRTDLYSLGVLMFQLLTGRLPYKADSLTQLMYKITKEPPPDLFAVQPDLKENGECIKVILDKLLQKEADDRYQDGKKLERDLLACARKMAGKK
ncbi:MAG: serine/threonine-protein kinase [Pseudomonadota bacterium]|nr:serine/threonine-protein kinase [Pseudomonadota bacterium]